MYCKGLMIHWSSYCRHYRADHETEPQYHSNEKAAARPSGVGCSLVFSLLTGCYAVWNDCS